MRPLQILRWTLSVDPEATRAAMATPHQGKGAEGCDCAYCRNYVAQRARLYPKTILDLFEAVGIDPERDVELVHYHRHKGDGLHNYGIWYHLVGRIESGADAWVDRSENSSSLSGIVPVDERFALGFSRRGDLLPKSFYGLPVVQLDIDFRAPWVLDEPDPDLD